MQTRSASREHTKQICRITKTPLSDEEITIWLQEARQHAFAEYSAFAVSAILEKQLPDGRFAYVLGVNVEHHGLNRASLHAEEVAQNTAQALLGNIPSRRIFVMGAPLAVQGCDDPGATLQITPCGHCRQILMSHSTATTRVYSVTVAGTVHDVGTMETLLPGSFSARDLGSLSEPAAQDAHAALGEGSALFFKAIHPTDLLSRHESLSRTAALQYLRTLSPSLISPTFCTSSVLACILQLTPCRYAVGVLHQDPAFLTIDAIPSALAQAITHFGAQAVQGHITAIHCYMKDEQCTTLTLFEKSDLHRFMGAQAIPVHYYDQQGSHAEHLLLPDMLQQSFAETAEPSAKHKQLDQTSYDKSDHSAAK